MSPILVSYIDIKPILAIHLNRLTGDSTDLKSRLT